MSHNDKYWKILEFESGVAKKVKVDGVAVAVVRIDDEIFAIADKCSHADVSLSDGVVWCETKQLECIKHGSAFNLVTGVPDTCQPHSQSLCMKCP